MIFDHISDGSCGGDFKDDGRYPVLYRGLLRLFGLLDRTTSVLHGAEDGGQGKQADERRVPASPPPRAPLPGPVSHLDRTTCVLLPAEEASSKAGGGTRPAPPPVHTLAPPQRSPRSPRSPRLCAPPGAFDDADLREHPSQRRVRVSLREMFDKAMEIMCQDRLCLDTFTSAACLDQHHSEPARFPSPLVRLAGFLEKSARVLNPAPAPYAAGGGAEGGTVGGAVAAETAYTAEEGVCLPEELLLLIFSYLDLRGLCSAASVCKSWHRIANDSLLWQHVYCTRWSKASAHTLLSILLCRCSIILPNSCSISECWLLFRALECARSQEGPPPRPLQSAAPQDPPALSDLQGTKISFMDKVSLWKILFRKRMETEEHWHAGTHRLQRLQGHNDWVRDVRYHDGRVISSSDDTTLKIWAVSSGSVIHTLTGHSAAISCFRDDDETVVSGSFDGTVRVWDLESGHCCATLVGHTAEISRYSLCFDDDIVAAGAVDGRILQWDFRSGALQHSFQAHDLAVNCMLSLPTHTSASAEWPDHACPNTLVTSSNDFKIKIWNPGIDHPLAVLRSHQRAVFALRMWPPLPFCMGNNTNNVAVETSPHITADHRLFSGSDDCTIKMWDLTTQQCCASLEEHRSSIIWFEVNAWTLVSGSDDNTVRVWDLRDPRRSTAVLKGHTNFVNCIQFDDTRIISGSGDCTIKVWDFRNTGECMFTLADHDDCVNTLQYDGFRIVSAADDSEVHINDFTTRRDMQDILDARIVC